MLCERFFDTENYFLYYEYRKVGQKKYNALFHFSRNSERNNPAPQKGKKNMAVEIDLEKEAEFDYDWLTKEDY